MTTVAVAETDGVALSQAPTEKDVIRKIFWRVLPYIVVLYMLNFIDRVNVSFAALTMSKDLGRASGGRYLQVESAHSRR